MRADRVNVKPDEWKRIGAYMVQIDKFGYVIWMYEIAHPEKRYVPNVRLTFEAAKLRDSRGTFHKLLQAF